jgi:hypothetical protein
MRCDLVYGQAFSDCRDFRECPTCGGCLDGSPHRREDDAMIMDCHSSTRMKFEKKRENEIDNLEKYIEEGFSERNKVIQHARELEDFSKSPYVQRLPQGERAVVEARASVSKLHHDLLWIHIDMMQKRLVEVKRAEWRPS